MKRYNIYTNTSYPFDVVSWLFINITFSYRYYYLVMKCIQQWINSNSYILVQINKEKKIINLYYLKEKLVLNKYC